MSRREKGMRQTPESRLTRSTESCRRDTLGPGKEGYSMCDTAGNSVGEQAPFRRAGQQRPGLVDPHQRSEEHTSELQSRLHLVCRLLLEKKKTDNASLHEILL